MFPSVACADDIDEFLIARDNFAAGEFAQAVVQLRRLVGNQPAQVRPALVETARKYLAAALYSQGQRETAEQIFELILRENPDAALSPVLFSAPVQQNFYDVRQRMLPITTALREQRQAAALATQQAREQRQREHRELLATLATRETVRVQTSPATVILPFGAAQFVTGQNGAGAAFLSAQVLLGGLALATPALCYALVMDVSNEETGRLGRCGGSGVGRPEESTLVAMQVTNVVAWSAFGLAFAGGALHAALTFRAERVEVRRRAPPPGFAEIQLAVLPTSAGAQLVLGGRF